MFRYRPWMMTPALAVLLSCGSARAATLDEELKAQASKIVEHLKEQKVEAVGVLKFLVSVGKGKLSDNVGPLNRGLANRLEVALVLALPDDSLRIITRASDAVVESGNRRATHRTARGRREFFPPRINAKFYKPAWGSGPIRPDAFLTGEARVSADLKTVAVKVQYFDKKDPAKLIDVCSFTAEADFPILGAAGVSYARTRGVVERDDDERFSGPAAPVPPPDAFLEEKPADRKEYLTAVENVPVKLQILYNGKRAKLEGDRLAEPGEGTRVTFRLSNESKNGKTYGVVLKVNGRNSIFYEKESPRFCHKWILEPGKTITVKGFQRLDEDRDDEFQVLSPELSEGYAVNYGDDAGKIQLVVFRQKTAADETVIKKDEAKAEVKPISRGTLTFEGPPPSSFEALKGRLMEAKDPKATSRGLIVGGKVGKSKIERVLFNPFPEPVLSRTIRYYDPPR
jgi:hypothetical protein